MTTKRGSSRRDFLNVVLRAVGVGLLAACAPHPPEAKPDAKPVVAPQPAAPSATSAPAQPAVPAATAPAAKPVAAAKPDEKIGKAFIGKLEGPEIIVDATQFPKQLKEAPMLADMVQANKLPRVDQRVPQDPLVIKPVHEIGRYGGTWRRGFTGPADKWNGYRSTSGPDHLLLYFLTYA